tara:strand:- start:1044 stop:1328 length:285 start_codon:yes stop_codon:yes gene_type:complete
MKVGDLVTLSTYAMKSEPMWALRKTVWQAKKPLVGLVVKIEENPYNRSWTSKNEGKFFYIQWMQDYGPMSRWGNSSYYRGKQGYFFRNDLKFVK